jgi:hypothetical protein
MFSIITSPSQHTAANEAFHRFLRRGQRAALLAKLSGDLPYLEDFNNYAFRLQGGRKHLGVQSIPVAAITGSAGRRREFDRQFRPLKKNLRDLWARAYQSSRDENGLPISVYKIGKAYFVVDGLDRLSVANSLGMKSIQADVWEFSCRTEHVEACQPDTQCMCNKVDMTTAIHA